MPISNRRNRFLELLRETVARGGLRKLTLGRYRGPDVSVRNLYVRPVLLKSGPCLSFLWRHATRDITKNLPHDQALSAIADLLGDQFLDAHLYTAELVAHLSLANENGAADTLRLTKEKNESVPPPDVSPSHDRSKYHLIDPASPWLQTLGITNVQGRPRSEMSAKFRQIQNFASLLNSLFSEAWPQSEATSPRHLVDMGCGKGYLTFAMAALFGDGTKVLGIERRQDLVESCNAAAQTHGLSNLSFAVGDIADVPLKGVDALIALHACDTATDDALGRGIAACARLLVVAPCCQKELRPQLRAPEILAPALRHGIFQERHAEFATDALRALLLEWAGYDTRVFEFISTEHTAKNVMIAAIKARPSGDEEAAKRARALAAFYGIRQQRLATLLHLELAS